MTLGFRANINQDSHRIFLTRLINMGIAFKGMQSVDSNEVYSFIFDSDTDFMNAQKLKRSMIQQYKDIPMN